MIDPKKPLGTSYVLSEADRDKFVRLWLEHAHTLPQPKPDRGHFPDHEEHQAPEVYAVRTDVVGIPAMTGFLPGSGTCTVYQPIDIDGDLTMTEVVGFELTIYNLSTDAIDGDKFVVVARDKYGRWFITGGVGGGSSDTEWVQAQAEGYSVLALILADNGNGLEDAGLASIQVTVPTNASYPRDPARSGGIYLAKKARGSALDSPTGTGTGTGTGQNSGWYIDTPPLTECVEIPSSNSTATLDCTTNQITFSNNIDVRVIAKPECS